VETPSRHSYDLDGTLRVFPVASPIKGDNYCRLEVDGVIINDRTQYDIVNNSIVFKDTSLLPSGSQLDILVVQSEEAIGQLAITTTIDTVAQDINNVNTVANSITDVNSVAANMAEVLTADTNAAIATAKASEASASAANAASSEASATQSAAESAGEALVSGTHATNSAASAAAAQASLDEFQGQYHGTSATDPTTNVDKGDMYFNSIQNNMRVFDGTNWISTATVATSTDEVTATAGQTVVATALSIQGISTLALYINGVKQSLLLIH